MSEVPPVSSHADVAELLAIVEPEDLVLVLIETDSPAFLVSLLCADGKSMRVAVSPGLLIDLISELRTERLEILGCDRMMTLH